jgi:hypothetical protein
MMKAFSTVRLVMLGIFAVVVIAIWSYQFLYAIPKERCDKAGLWWAAKWRSCTSPVDITTLTGRRIVRPVEPGDKPAPVLAQPAAK